MFSLVKILKYVPFQTLYIYFRRVNGKWIAFISGEKNKHLFTKSIYSSIDLNKKMNEWKSQLFTLNYIKTYLNLIKKKQTKKMKFN